MVKTVVFYSIFWLSLIVLFPIGIFIWLLRLVGLKSLATSFLRKLAQAWARLVIAGTGSTLRADGLENIPLEGGVCFVGNHPGDFDIFIALALINRPFGFTAKKESLFFPFIGFWIWLLGGVFIDRKNARKALSTIKKGAERIRRGGAMIIFPEGTRNRGKGMLPFRSGAFKLATMAEAPIVPVSISGSWKVWEESNRVHGADVRVLFGAPLRTKGITPDERRALPEVVRAAIEDGIATIEGSMASIQ